jgi:hypothetical protein
MKLLVNILRILIGLYMSILILVWAVFFTAKKFDYDYPSINGYSYYVVDTDNLEPEIPNETFLIIKIEDKEYTAKEGDFVLFQDGEILRLKQVKKENASEMNQDEYVVGFLNETEENYQNLLKKNVIAKAHYHNSVITLVYKILTNWMVILVLLIFEVLSPTLFGKAIDDK